MLARLLMFGFPACALFAQTPCAPTPIYGRCELVFELQKAELAEHSNPYSSVRLHAELRSPRHRTLALPAYWDGGGRFVVRFAPTEAGDWEFRVTSNIQRLNGTTGKITAIDADHPGFVRPANGHHWMTIHNRQPHLWMGDTSYYLAWAEDGMFRTTIDARSSQRFTHIRMYGIGRDDRATFSKTGEPDVKFYRNLDERVTYANSKGLVVDLILGHDRNHLAEQFNSYQLRERYIRYMASRYSAFNITWQVTQEFEEYENGRGLAKEIGSLLKQHDTYRHPRTTHSVRTSSPLLADGWMDHILYQSSDDDLGSIEHQLYAAPAVNSEFAYEDSGAGRTHDHHVDSETLRRRLWNATMNGQYPTFGNTGTYGSMKLPQDAKYLESPGARAMTVWFEFMSRTRYWELEPYFELDSGRALALPGVEYIVYVEKPTGPVEVRLEKHDYDVQWVNPATGEAVKAKNFKAERYAAEPPAADHDWILHISREGRKEGMLRSYKFESREFVMQEIETAAARIPFEIAQPSANEISVSNPPRYEAKLKRESRGTRFMRYLWTGEVAANSEGSRVLGTGGSGKLEIPKMFLKGPAPVVNVRLYGMNANGKVYALDRIYKAIP